MEKSIMLMLSLMLAQPSFGNITLQTPKLNYFSAWPGLAIDSQRQQAVSRSLAGTWENFQAKAVIKEDCDDINPGMEVRRLKLRYEFAPNGAFSKTMTSGNNDLVLHEYGRWEVSPDGENLLLLIDGGSNGEAVQRLRIKYLEFDEMVLEHPYAMLGLRFDGDNQDLFFNKH
jgi:hypothetical protein